MGDAAAHWGFEPRTDSIHLVDTLFVRKIRLAENSGVKETFKVEHFTETRFLVDTEEDM